MCQADIRLAGPEYIKQLTNPYSPYKRRVKNLWVIKAIIALGYTLSLKIFELLGFFCPESDFCIVFLTFLDIFSPWVGVEVHMWRSEIHTMCHPLTPSYDRSITQQTWNSPFGLDCPVHALQDYLSTTPNPGSWSTANQAFEVAGDPNVGSHVCSKHLMRWANFPCPHCHFWKPEC